MNIVDDKLQIHDAPYRIIRPDKISASDWCVIWIQGFGGSIADHTERVSRLVDSTNVPFAMVDYAGQGNSTIKLDDSTRQMQIDEVCVLYDRLVELGYSKFIVLGNSLGSYLTAMLIESRMTECIVLRAPSIYPDNELTVAHHDKDGEDKLAARKTWRSNVSAHDDIRALHSIENFTGDVYVIQHDQDEVIPANIPRAYYERAVSSNYIHIPNCHHTPKTMSDPETYHSIIEAWLETIINNEVLTDIKAN